MIYSIHLSYILIEIMILIIISISLIKLLSKMSANIVDIKNLVLDIKGTLILEIGQISQAISLLQQTVIDGGTQEQRQEVLDMLVAVRQDIINIIPETETPVVEEVVPPVVPVTEDVVTEDEVPTEEVVDDSAEINEEN
jgi:hypothetical protein